MGTLVFPYAHTKDPDVHPGHLSFLIASQLSLSSPPSVEVNNTDITVTATGVGEASRSAIQSLIDGYVFDQAWAMLGTGQDGIYRFQLRQAYATLRQWAQDAATTNANWPTMTAAQKDAAMRETIRRLGVFLDRFADATFLFDPR